MYRVLIADDEKMIRMGLASIIDWHALGYEICGEASNGSEALSYILVNKPDVVLIDIRMPKTTGLEAIKQARSYGYTGEFIVLSGFADFEYAKQAIEHNVFAYLNKPVDTDELTDALTKIKDKLDKSAAKVNSDKFYKSKAKKELIGDFLTGKLSYNEFTQSYNYKEDNYQIGIYERYSINKAEPDYDLSKLLRVNQADFEFFDFINYDNKNIVIIKGNNAIKKFQNFTGRYERELPPEKNSPLHTIFMACSNIIASPRQLPEAYEEVKRLSSTRFFCDPHQHIVTPDNMPRVNDELKNISIDEIKNKFTDLFINNIQAYNRNIIAESLKELKGVLFYSSLSIPELKNLLIDIYLAIKEKISYLYSKVEISFMPNSEAVSYILQSYYLFEIISFLSEQFEMIISSIGYSSRDSIIDDIVHYINHNYSENITLENLAPLFGYNSSYLGKIFNQKMNCNFNTYLDNVRIEHSKELLKAGKLQVYKIAEMVGYRNVDYFHIKFKKNTGMSPAEFRRSGSLF